MCLIPVLLLSAFVCCCSRNSILPFKSLPAAPKVEARNLAANPTTPHHNPNSRVQGKPQRVGRSEVGSEQAEDPGGTRNAAAYTGNTYNNAGQNSYQPDTSYNTINTYDPAYNTPNSYDQTQNAGNSYNPDPSYNAVHRNTYDPVANTGVVLENGNVDPGTPNSIVTDNSNYHGAGSPHNNVAAYHHSAPAYENGGGPPPNTAVMYNTDIAERKNKVEDIYFRFYNGVALDEFIEIPLAQAILILQDKSFDMGKPTVLYIHGFIESGSRESVEVVVRAYLDSRPDTNVVLLDWSNMAQGSYVINAVPNSKKVGVATGEQIYNLFRAGFPLESLHIVGHSLGCHVAGYAARLLKNTYFNLIRRITALDPSFPAFYPENKAVMQHLSEADAEFVDVIHTDAGGYGAPVRTGTADFWPNGGRSAQPGCPRYTPVPLTDNNLCSHWRAWQLYAESVRTPDAFPASPAESYQKFLNNPNTDVGVVYMGIDCDTSAQGSYYMTTSSETPYGRGMAGIYARKRRSKSHNEDTHDERYSSKHRERREISCEHCQKIQTIVRSLCKDRH